MKRVLLRFWFGSKARIGSNSSYMTLELDSVVGVDWDESFFQVWNDGLVIIPCADYRIVGSKCSEDYAEKFKLSFDGSALSIRTANEESLTFGLPVLIN